MALNWAMISDDGTKPVPLPREKVFYSAEKCHLTLEFASHKRSWTADGTAFVTSQRILFLRQPPLPAPADPSVSSEHLRTLSVPLTQFADTRYLIPLFSAPHYEARILPSVDGGLPQRQSGGPSNVGLLKIWFNEGGGMAFRDAVEEVKSRREEGATGGEALPLYERNQGDQAGETSAAQAEGTRDAPPRRLPTRSDSLPAHDDIVAAQVAREQEECERDEQRQQASSARPNEGAELPPAYQA